MSETAVNDTYQAAFERCGVEESMRGPDHFLFDRAPDGSVWPIPRAISYNHQDYDLTDKGSLIHSTAVISPYSAIGSRVIIDRGVSINRGTTVKNHVTIGEDTTIGESVGTYGTHISEWSVIGRNVRIGSAVKVGVYAVIGDGAEFGTEVEIGSHSKVGEGVKVGSGTEIMHEATIDSYTAIGLYSYIGESVFVGERSKLGNNVVVNRYANLMADTLLRDKAKVKKFALVVNGTYRHIKKDDRRA